MLAGGLMLIVLATNGRGGDAPAKARPPIPAWSG
jgi:hypothetical protein